MQSISLDIVLPQDLTASDKALWSQWVAENGDLSGPYFDFRYFEAAAPQVPGARIARISREGNVIAFLPFQKRGGVVQPLGAPLTDFHGLIMSKQQTVDLSEVLKGLGGRRIEFSGFTNTGPALARAQTRQRLYADLSAGFDAWYKARFETHKKFYRNVERCRRNFDKDLSDLSFSWEPAGPDLINWVVAQKRGQYRRTGLHDIFACGWTKSVLTALARGTGDRFGLMAGVYRQGDQVIAAEIALRSGDALHLWFPAYDPDYARYGPGILLSLDILKSAAAEGVRRVDFGFGDETYKATMTDSSDTCLDGSIGAVGLPSLSAHPLARGLKARIAVIRACETRLTGQVWAVGLLGRRALVRGRVAVLATTGLLGVIGAGLIATEVM